MDVDRRIDAVKDAMQAVDPGVLFSTIHVLRCDVEDFFVEFVGCILGNTDFPVPLGPNRIVGSGRCPWVMGRNAAVKV